MANLAETITDYIPLFSGDIPKTTKTIKKIVALENILASQTYFDSERIIEINENPPTNLIWLYQIDDDKYVIRDGHHRTIAAIKNNKTHIKAIVFTA